MKKHVAIALMLILTLFLVSCSSPASYYSQQNTNFLPNNKDIPLDTIDEQSVIHVTEPKHIETIIDHAEKDRLVTADALEGFYTDENYSYYFGSIKSQYVIVYFKDGTQKPVIDALRDGSVCIQDLDYFKIGYIATPKQQ